MQGVKIAWVLYVMQFDVGDAVLPWKLKWTINHI